MRNSLNTQVWSFRHPDFLAVSATHGTAGLALFGPAMWEKYQLAKLTGGKFQSNTLVSEQKGAAADPKDYENPEGLCQVYVIGTRNGCIRYADLQGFRPLIRA